MITDILCDNDDDMQRKIRNLFTRRTTPCLRKMWPRPRLVKRVSRRLETKTQVSRTPSLGLETSESWSRSWSWNLRVLVSVLVLVTPRTPNSDPWVEVARSDTYKVLHPLLEKVFCPPVTSAPVERIFSHSGLLMRANRARMKDNMLSQLVYLRCNNKL